MSILTELPDFLRGLDDIEFETVELHHSREEEDGMLLYFQKIVFSKRDRQQGPRYKFSGTIKLRKDNANWRLSSEDPQMTPSMFARIDREDGEQIALEPMLEDPGRKELCELCEQLFKKAILHNTFSAMLSRERARIARLKRQPYMTTSEKGNVEV